MLFGMEYVAFPLSLFGGLLYMCAVANMQLG